MEINPEISQSTSAADVNLVERARQGEREAFDALVLRYQGQAVLMAQNILRNWESAKDASQNAFARAYFRLKQLNDGALFKTWFLRIVINEAKDIFRKEKARGFFKFAQAPSQETDEEPESILDIIPAPNPSAREVLERAESVKILERAMDALPEREREVLMLRYFHGLSVEEAAQTLDIAIGTVKAHSAHGTEKLKSILSTSLRGGR